MERPDLERLMAELMAAHRETEHHVVRMMERQSDLETTMQELKAMTAEIKASNAEMKARNGEIERLTIQVAEQNIRLSRIIEAHD